MSRFAPSLRRRFELIGGTSMKFWEVQVEGKEVTVRFGRIGSDGQKQSETLPDEAKAAAHLESLIRAKLAKGYQEVGTPRAA